MRYAQFLTSSRYIYKKSPYGDFFVNVTPMVPESNLLLKRFIAYFSDVNEEAKVLASQLSGLKSSAQEIS